MCVYVASEPENEMHKITGTRVCEEENGAANVISCVGVYEILGLFSVLSVQL